jgi:hypothetical protein
MDNVKQVQDWVHDGIFELGNETSGVESVDQLSDYPLLKK